MKTLFNQELKMSPLKNNVANIIIFVSHEDTEAQRQDQLDNLQNLVKIKMQGPLFKNY